MATENFNGIEYVDMLMAKKDTTQDEMKEAYKAWSKTYEVVSITFLNNASLCL